MSASRGQKKLHSNSDVAPPEPPKRARKAPQKYEPPAPSKPSKKRAPARSKRPANAPAPEPSPDRESEVEDVLSAPPPPPTAPLYVPHSIYIYMPVTIDSKDLAAVNAVIDLKDPSHFNLAYFEARAKAQIDQYTTRRPGLQVYRGSWKASYGSARDRKYCSMNSDQD